MIVSRIIRAILLLTAKERSTAAESLHNAKNTFIDTSNSIKESNPLDKIAQQFSAKIAAGLNNAEIKIKQVEEEKTNTYTSDREMGLFL